MRAISTLVLTTAALVATALPAAANAQVEAAVVIQSQARLEARGAAVTVPMSVLCERGATGSLSVQVTQNVRGELAIGEKYLPISKCTGRYERLNVTVVSRTRAFRPGVAFSSASLSVYTPDATNVVDEEREVMLVR